MSRVYDVCPQKANLIKYGKEYDRDERLLSCAFNDLLLDLRVGMQLERAKFGFSDSMSYFGAGGATRPSVGPCF